MHSYSPSHSHGSRITSIDFPQCDVILRVASSNTVGTSTVNVSFTTVQFIYHGSILLQVLPASTTVQFGSKDFTCLCMYCGQVLPVAHTEQYCPNPNFLYIVPGT